MAPHSQGGKHHACQTLMPIHMTFDFDAKVIDLHDLGFGNKVKVIDIV